MSDERQQAIRLYDAFTHEHRDRRRLLKELALLAGSTVAAEALIAGISPNPAAAQQTSHDDPRLITDYFGVGDDRGGPGDPTDRGYLAKPRAAGRYGAVMVIHENRGLNDHIRDVTRRLALAGFVAFAPDFLVNHGGSPDYLSQPGAQPPVQDRIAALTPEELVAQGLWVINWLRTVHGSDDRVGTVGFCWGGGLVNRLAITAGTRLDAAVAYYGPAPDPREAVQVRAPMLLHYAGLDERVDATGRPWVAALQAAGRDVTAFTYPRVNHAFNNDTAADRYDRPAAELAWVRTTAFLHRHLDARR